MAFGKRHPDRFVVNTTPSLVYEHIDINLDNPKLADPRVRLALTLSIDRDTICRYVFDGQQQPATSFVPPLDQAFSPDTPSLSYDPIKAAKLLDEAGYKLVDGVRVGPDGQTLSFDLMTTAGNRSRELVAEILQAQWRKMGILIRVKLEPPRIFFGQTVTKRRFKDLAMFAWYSAPESVPRSILRSTEIPSADNGWAGENYTGYKNTAMDRLMDETEEEPDFAKRKPLWQQMQALYNQDLPAIPLFFRSDAHIWPKQLHGVKPTGHADPSPLWVENWTWD
jgi:peptide/nickel transport system substrate-binding protein